MYFYKEIDNLTRKHAYSEIEKLFAPLKYVFHPDFYIITYRGIKWIFSKSSYSIEEIKTLIPWLIKQGDKNAEETFNSFTNPIYIETLKHFKP